MLFTLMFSESIWVDPTWFNLILVCSSWFDVIWFHVECVWFNCFELFQFELSVIDSMLFGLTRCYLIWVGSNWVDLIQFGSTWYNSIRCYSIKPKCNYFLSIQHVLVWFHVPRVGLTPSDFMWRCLIMLLRVDLSSFDLIWFGVV